MKVEQWKIGDIKPYENNPRINEDAVEKTAMSIREYGWQQPIVVDHDGVIIVGHTRLKAAKSLGLTECPVLVAEDLSGAQAKAYRIADNKTGEIATWDQELLNMEIEGLVDMNFDIELTGFSLDDFDFLNGGGNDAPGAGGDEDIPDDKYQEQYGVIIMCESESDQEKVFNEMTEQGYNCRVVTT